MLITLVIIGVIAALTIPNLMQKYTEQTTVKKVQKFYSTLSNAYSLAMKENGPANEWGLLIHSEESAIKIYDILFKPYFKITKNCGVNNAGKCVIDNSYKQLDNATSNSYGTTITNYYKVVLNDGAAIWWISGNQPFYNIDIYYDINGTKRPNQWGIDLFSFIIFNEKIFPSGSPNSYTSRFNDGCVSPSGTFGSGKGCAAWVVYKGNMDYLHCDGLTWQSRSCKDK